MPEIKVPELPPVPEDYVMSENDMVLGWLHSLNKTVKIGLDKIRIFALAGGESILIPPVVNGNSIMKKITEVEEGTQRVDIPEIAGKDFKLRRRGGGALIPGEEFNPLSSGGFVLLKEGDILQDEEIFEIDLFNLSGGTPSTPSGAGTALITGVMPVATNQTLSVDHIYKLIQFRAGENNILTLTLPSLADFPKNVIVPIEALIGNSRQHKIMTQGGQYIYGYNTNTDHIYISPGENIWLLSTDDGWYPINYNGNFFDVGTPSFGFKLGINDLEFDGSLLPRAHFPRLWEWIQSLGPSLVSEATWQIASVNFGSPARTILDPYKGCFSTGDGLTTFRMPLWRGKGIRGLKNVGSTDPDRYYNYTGGFQDDMLESHQHDLPVDGVGSSDRQSLVPSSNSDENLNGANLSGATGGNETRMENIGVIYFIKA